LGPIAAAVVAFVLAAALIGCGSDGDRQGAAEADARSEVRPSTSTTSTTVPSTTAPSTTVPTTIAPPTTQPDPCGAQVIAADLGVAVETVAVAGCVDGWADVDACVGCGGDTEALLRRVDGRWQMAIGFPASLCMDQAAALGVPAAFRSPERFGPCAPATDQRCGEVASSIGTPVVVVADFGVGCAEARAVVDRYYNDDTLVYQGSSGSAEFDGWLCASNSGAGTEQTGDAGSCYRDSPSAEISMLVP
jgi:hypothetical protein